MTKIFGKPDEEEEKEPGVQNDITAAYNLHWTK